MALVCMGTKPPLARAQLEDPRRGWRGDLACGIVKTVL